MKDAIFYMYLSGLYICFPGLAVAFDHSKYLATLQCPPPVHCSPSYSRADHLGSSMEIRIESRNKENCLYRRTCCRNSEALLGGPDLAAVSPWLHFISGTLILKHSIGDVYHYALLGTQKKPKIKQSCILEDLMFIQNLSAQPMYVACIRNVRRLLQTSGVMEWEHWLQRMILIYTHASAGPGRHAWDVEVWVAVLPWLMVWGGFLFLPRDFLPDFGTRSLRNELKGHLVKEKELWESRRGIQGRLLACCFNERERPRPALVSLYLCDLSPGWAEWIYPLSVVCRLWRLTRVVKPVPQCHLPSTRHLCRHHRGSSTDSATIGCDGELCQRLLQGQALLRGATQLPQVVSILQPLHQS
ncbi:hypothetical protein JZ751_025064 [Albula glossodonta]|uniref:Uncharacterized protein n=1 Tax=Albula glossodonta TaxID=121402 RepID=A0A8T2PF87_9TELE|nr:hypothetical protein JZ751_025064 [Albula glossodonta]